MSIKAQTHFGVRIGLHAGSSCCENLESEEDNRKTEELCSRDRDATLT